MSKTQRILEAREILLGNFNVFASLANGWTPENEDDYSDLEGCVDTVLENLVKAITEEASA